MSLLSNLGRIFASLDFYSTRLKKISFVLFCATRVNFDWVIQRVARSCRALKLFFFSFFQNHPNLFPVESLSMAGKVGG